MNSHKLILILLVLILFFYPNSVSSDGNYLTFRVISPSTLPDGIVIHNKTYIRENHFDSILINITFYSEFPLSLKDFRSGEYYLIGEKIIAIGLYIDRINSTSTMENLTLSIFSPSDKMVSNIVLIENMTRWGGLFTVHLNDKAFVFNEEGLWKILIELNSNNKNIIWKAVEMQNSNYMFLTFMPTEGEKDILDDLIFYNYYKESIPVISNFEQLQVSTMNYISQQTEYLKDTASHLNNTAVTIEKASNQSSEYQKDYLGYFFLYLILVGISVTITLFASIYSACKSKQNTGLTENQIKKYIEDEISKKN